MCTIQTKNPGIAGSAITQIIYVIDHQGSLKALTSHEGIRHTIFSCSTIADREKYVRDVLIRDGFYAYVQYEIAPVPTTQIDGIDLYEMRCDPSPFILLEDAEVEDLVDINNEAVSCYLSMMVTLQRI